MDQYPIKSVTFGGFDRQSVVEYIDKIAREAAEAQAKLREDNDALQTRLDALEQELAALQTQRDQETARREELERQSGELTARLEAESAARQELEGAREEAARLSAQVEELKPDAQAYAQFRERIGAIECEARERAAALEADTAARLQRTVDQFRGQYQVLMRTFETTAAHVNGELRKVEVNLTQLPRAMDRPGTELNELAALLAQKKEQAQSSQPAEQPSEN